MDEAIFSEDYLRRLAGDDEAAWLHFKSHFRPLLRRALHGPLRSKEEIEDAIQETYLRVLLHARDGTIDQPERLGGFVYQVCRNVSREAIRREIKHKGSDFDSPDTADGRWQPDEALVNEENKKSVRVVLEKMPERERWLLKALFLEERDKNEICRELGIDRDNLRVRVHRALKRTRGEWEKGHGAGE